MKQLQRGGQMTGQQSDRPEFTAGMARICPAEETLGRMMPHMRHFGVTRLANVTGLDHVGLPVVVAIRPGARSVAVSQGKGRTLAHAKASALMEAIEIWHAERFSGPVRYASISDLEDTFRFVDLGRLPRTPAGPPPRTIRLHWVEAQELISAETRLVPYEMVHADYTHPVPDEARWFAASTNGLASGNHRSEAICHAICEVVERDALSLWHHAPPHARRGTLIDLSTVSDPGLTESLQRFSAAGLKVAVWDITSDTGVPSYLCYVRDTAGRNGHCGLGSGTFPEPVTALHRALNEAAQTRLNYISGAREDLFHSEFTEAGRIQKTDPYEEVMTNTSGGLAFGDTSGFSPSGPHEACAWLIRQLRTAGIDEVAVVDLTRDAPAVPVVRVIIPGLEAPHDDSAYVPGPRALSVSGAVGS